jgi:hypothetical protein
VRPTHHRSAVYSDYAVHSDWRQTRYDQPMDHLRGGADEATRPGLLSRHGCGPHCAGCPDPLALARWQGRTRRHDTAQSPARPQAVCRTHPKVRLPGMCTGSTGLPRGRVNTLCTHEAGLRPQLALFHVYHNFVLPHASLRLPLPEPRHGRKSGKRWRQRTPAMAAGVTDHIWSLREVLMFRVLPWPQPLAE